MSKGRKWSLNKRHRKFRAFALRVVTHKGPPLVRIELLRKLIGPGLNQIRPEWKAKPIKNNRKNRLRFRREWKQRMAEKRAADSPGKGEG